MNKALNKFAKGMFAIITIKLLFFSIVFLIQSCQTDKECVSCYSTEYGSSKISINNNEVSFKYWLESDNKLKEENEYLIYISRIEPVLAHKILLSSINYNFDFESNDLASFSFFTEKDIKGLDSLNSKDILGFQLYRQKGHNLITEIFKLTENEVIKIDDLTSTVNYLSTNDIYDCSKIFNSKKIRTIMVINNQFKFEPKKELGKSILSSKLIKYKEKTLNYKSRIIENENNTSINASCSKPCVNYSGDCITVYDGGLPPQPNGFTCFRNICGLQQIAIEEKTPEKELKNELNSARDFRDNFLTNYSIGKKYIRYYYNLSYTYKSLYSETQWSKFKSIKPLLINKMNKILNNNDNNKIFINEKEKVQLLEFVNTLKVIDNSNSFQNMISQMQYDINRFSSKSISEVNIILDKTATNTLYK
jgi:hypothetical protein